MTDDERHDALIDGVARDMTSAWPDDGFARRVAAMIQEDDAASHARRSRRSWLWVPAAACVLVSAVLAMYLVRPALHTPEVTPRGRDVADVTRSGRENANEHRPDSSAASAVRETTTVAARASQSASSGVRALPAATAIAGDADLQPLTTTPIDVTSLEIPPLVTALPIEISAIAIYRIEIAAMP